MKNFVFSENGWVARGKILGIWLGQKGKKKKKKKKKKKANLTTTHREQL
jgi:hypothetical protein